MAGQSLMGVTCTYLGEVLAAVIIFRDARTPFTDDDAAALKAISPIFATALASMVKDSDAGGDDEFLEGGGGLLDGGDDDKPKKKDKTSDADWWKRGEDPPF
jgi:hypothetical protein